MGGLGSAGGGAPFDFVRSICLHYVQVPAEAGYGLDTTH